MKNIKTISELLERRVERASHSPAVSVETSSAETCALTSEDLLAKGRSAAGYLQSQGISPGARVIVICDGTLNAIISILAVVESGCIAVPVPPLRKRRDLQRVSAIIADCQPIAFTCSSLAATQMPKVREMPMLLDLDQALLNSHDVWKRPSIKAEATALLQYTSGSTGNPKGVQISQLNLLSNLRMIERAFGLDCNQTAVFWLPLYHDMGLIGGLFQALYSGYPVHFIDPAEFARNPLRWLDLMSASRATVSGSPNIGYDLCIRAVRERLRERDGRDLMLDLSNWKVAFCGAEAISRRTLDRFSRTFKASQFSRRAFRPCYGLAEATLLVSVAGPTRSVKSIRLDRNQLIQGGIRIVAKDGYEVVSVGKASSGTEIRIVNPETLSACDPMSLGEICVSSSAITSGYWNHERPSEPISPDKMPHDERFLRTGDLGFLHKDELFVAGRLKDLIKIHGASYHPDDIESAIRKCDRLLEHNLVVAFSSLATDGGEVLIVVQEIPRRLAPRNYEVIVSAIRACLVADFGLAEAIVLLAPIKSIPRTSSGKVRRQDCRSEYYADRLTVLYVSSADASTQEEALRIRGMSDVELTSTIAKFIDEKVGLRLDGTALELPLSNIGIDSLALVELRSMLVSRFGVRVEIEGLLDLSVKSLATMVVASKDPKPQRSVQIDRAEETRYCTLSAGQNALWFLQQADPGTNAHIIARWFRINGLLDRSHITRCFDELVRRHRILTARMTYRDGSPILEYRQESIIEEIDLTSMSEINKEELVTSHRDATNNLTGGVLAKVKLIILGSDRYVLGITASHLVVDFRSMVTIVEDMAEIFHRNPTQHSLPNREGVYGDFVTWQAKYLKSDQAAGARQYLEHRLHPCTSSIRLPTRSQLRGRGSASYRFTVTEVQVTKLTCIAQALGVTLQSIFLASLGMVLSSYADKGQFFIGSIYSGRTTEEFMRTVGYFANILPVPISLMPSERFADMVRRLSKEMNRLLDLQDFPYVSLIEHIPIERSGLHTPLMPVVCNWLSGRGTKVPNLAPIALGLDGGPWKYGAISIESFESTKVDTQFDLTVTCYENSATVDCVLNYAPSYLEAQFISGIATDWTVLINKVCGNPDVGVDVCRAAITEETAPTVQWENATSAAVQLECIHRIFHQTAKRLSEKTAIIHYSDSVSFGELAGRVTRLAAFLQRLGARPEARIAVLGKRSIDTVVAIFGILTAGAAYVPIDESQPRERVRAFLREAEVSIVVRTNGGDYPLNVYESTMVINLDDERIAHEDLHSIKDNAHLKNLAYVMFTSGSSGTPKGVLVQHDSLSNFCVSMDAKIGESEADCLLAMTPIGFDISILELLWTLTRGVRIVIADGLFEKRMQKTYKTHRPMRGSVFYFANSATASGAARYKLLVEGAKMADTLGFSAVWTPERHFHSFGGLYPNPSITSAALATITSRLAIRGGSVVMPLHNPIRVAEEWAVVDNLSNGRAGVAFASGWHPKDFVLNPDKFGERRSVTLEGIETVRRLWRGESVTVPGIDGNPTPVEIFPKPVNTDIPIWLTAAGSPETFKRAAMIRANVLTHLLGQSISDLSKKLADFHSIYGNNHSRDNAISSLMLHTYIDASEDRARDRARAPFVEYLKSSIDLLQGFANHEGLSLKASLLSPRELDDLGSFAAERYMKDSGLFGSPRTCRDKLDALREIHVTEIAALIDFGIDTHSALQSLKLLGELLTELAAESEPRRQTLWEYAHSTGVTLFQCTPTFIESLIADVGCREFMAQLRILLVGGETLPHRLLEEVRASGVGEILNMYGPTETTIWSSSRAIQDSDKRIVIGGPIQNTQLHIVDGDMNAMPCGALGEVAIGGAGLARGYMSDAMQTAERFRPDPFVDGCGGRLYMTGDIGRRNRDGTIEILGREDQQVKIRGHRVELGEIETALGNCSGIRRAAVVFLKEDNEPGKLEAFVIPNADISSDVELKVKSELALVLPEHMLPTRVTVVDEFPTNGNGKLDRSLLARWSKEAIRCRSENAIVQSTVECEKIVHAIWAEVLPSSGFSMTDNFFDIGGHSLLMAQVHRKLEERFCTSIPLITMLESPTVRATAAILNNKVESGTLHRPDISPRHGMGEVVERSIVHRRTV